VFEGSTNVHTVAVLRLWPWEVEINRMTLKLEDDLDILKMYPHSENEDIQHLEFEFKKYKNRLMYQDQRSRSKCHKLRTTSSGITTYIPIKKFPTSSFWVARCRFFSAVTLTLDPWFWNWTVKAILSFTHKIISLVKQFRKVHKKYRKLVIF